MGKLELKPGQNLYGYIRVSTAEQNTDRQEIALIDYGVDPSHLFIDHLSGKNFNRPNYKRLIRIIQRGDIIVIKSIDRLGRNYQDITDQWRMITQDIGCGIHVIDMPALNTTGDPDDLISRFITDMMLQVLSFVAQNERENTIKRQKEGIAAAKKRGKLKIGRPKIRIPFEFWEIYILWKTNAVKTKEITKMCKEVYGMSNRTFYRRIREIDMRYGDIPPEKLREYIVEDDFKDGIEMSMERCEAAVGYYNIYTTSPIYVERKKKEKREYLAAHPEMAPDPDREAKEEEEELKRIILEKRQAEFRERFGITDENLKSPKKTRSSRTLMTTPSREKQIRKEAEQAMTKGVKTIIID